MNKGTLKHKGYGADWILDDGLVTVAVTNDQNETSVVVLPEEIFRAVAAQVQIADALGYKVEKKGGEG